MASETGRGEEWIASETGRGEECEAKGGSGKRESHGALEQRTAYDIEAVDGDSVPPEPLQGPRSDVSRPDEHVIFVDNVDFDEWDVNTEILTRRTMMARKAINDSAVELAKIRERLL
jgi:hypothetical protein